MVLGITQLLEQTGCQQWVWFQDWTEGATLTAINVFSAAFSQANEIPLTQKCLAVQGREQWEQLDLMQMGFVGAGVCRVLCIEDGMSCVRQRAQITSEQCHGEDFCGVREL